MIPSTQLVRSARIAVLVFSAVSAVLALSACEPILTQNPKEHFASGQLPPSAARLANQVWDLPSRESVAARLARDATNPHLVRVGVMDNGVDIAHPDLIDQIDYKMNDGRIVGAGVDVMGGDAFGSPQILRYEYYAFGAEKLENHRIVRPAKDPFVLLKSLDDAFLADFIPKLRATESLRNTLYAKFDATNFSLLAAHQYALAEIDEPAYAKLERENKLMKPGWVPTDTDAASLRTQLERAYPYIHAKYVLGRKTFPVGRHSYSGSDSLFEPKIFLNYTVGAKDFHALVKREFAAFARASGYQKHFDLFVAFIGSRLFDKSDPQEVRIRKGIEKLAAALYFRRAGYSANDPLRDLEDGLATSALYRRLFSLSAWPTAPVTATLEDIRSVSKENLELMREVATVVTTERSRFETREIDAAKEFLKRVQGWSNLYQDYLNERGWDDATGTFARPLPPAVASAYRRFLVKTKHPLLDPASVNQSHGTHVSGIIAKQNPNIRIVPIRVVTESTKSSPAKDPALLADFQRGFGAWIREPLVVRALESYLGPATGGKKGAELITNLMQVYDERIPKDFEQSKLDYRFLGEVEEAVIAAGRERLKLVNISLGTTFDRAVVDYRNIDLEKRIESSFEFLKFEYFKWRIGKTVIEKAPNTLFLIATGNDGAWRDGRSRSALPADLSSPFLGDFEDPARGMTAPNNRIKNILGVGSLSQIDEVSYFSNILITKAPMVMAHGEAVLSPVRAISSEATDPIWTKSLAISASLGSVGGLAFQDERFADFLATRYRLPTESKARKEALKNLRRRIQSEMQVFAQVDAGLRTHLFLTYPNVRARMSGTSMATPTLTGLLANEIQKRLVAGAIPATALYEHPDFAPAKLIEFVQSKSEPMFQGSTVINLRKWTGELEWGKSPGEIELEARILRAKTTVAPRTGASGSGARGSEGASTLMTGSPSRNSGWTLRPGR